jgi:1-acyl-sn-glycerol-3-phosphate acyltransferase
MRIGIRIGRPLDFSRYEGMEEDRFVLRSITDEIMYELMLLSHQEYVDVYAASMKNRLVDAARAKAKELHRDGLGRSAATVPPPAAVEPSVPPAGPGDERAAS